MSSGSFVRTEEYRKKMSLALKGKKHKFSKRAPRSEEYKAKLSAIKKGKPFSGTPHDPTGTKHSDATKLKMSLSRQREKHPRWKGGKTINDQGYIILQEVGKKIREHRLIMENIVGRPLLKIEVVHHIDRDRKNNNPENLKLMLRTEHDKFHSEEKRKK